jgi:hypothetical protein
MRPTLQSSTTPQITKTPAEAAKPADPASATPLPPATVEAHEAPTTTTDAAKAEATATADGGVGKSRSKTIISISVEPKIARQARLLAKIRGVSLSSLFVEAAAVSIPLALKAALSSIKDDLEG